MAVALIVLALVVGCGGGNNLDASLRAVQTCLRSQGAVAERSETPAGPGPALDVRFGPVDAGRTYDVEFTSSEKSAKGLEVFLRTGVEVHGDPGTP